ncbi:MAG TPA: hypothetical protein VHD76_17955 [Bryobacteraceae bacterium]|jgi:hypothetical protein|nr:hypothetical protein [Bryobacteraceae bacterium]
MQFLASTKVSALLALSFALPAGPLSAQQVISARSGVVQYVEGDVTLGGEALNPQAGEFPAIRKNDVLHTGAGRVEILLTPGVFLRTGENTSIRMVANSLVDTQVEFLDGSALLECDDLLKDNAVTVLHGGAKVQLKRNGLYRFDSNPARVGVYNGEALVQDASGKTITLKGGHQAQFEGALAESRFDSKLAEDALYRWSARRSSYVAMANVSAAKQIQDVGGGSWSNSVWAFNPAFGMYTYVPYGSSLYSPFGYGFLNPYDALSFYNAYPYYYGGGYYPSGRYGTAKGGSGGGGSSTVAHTAPYTSRQLGYSTGARTANVGVIGRSAEGGRGGRSTVGSGGFGSASRGDSGGFVGGRSSGMASPSVSSAPSMSGRGGGGAGSSSGARSR